MSKKYIITEVSINHFRIKFNDTFECLAIYQNGYVNAHYYQSGDIYDSYYFIEGEKVRDDINDVIEYYENSILN